MIGGGAVAAKVATDPRTTGTQIDDETLEFKVENAVEKDAQIKAEGRVNAVSYNGRVLLIGQVPNSDVKDTATALAKGVEGVNEVYNELTVSPKSLLHKSVKIVGSQRKSNLRCSLMVELKPQMSK